MARPVPIPITLLLALGWKVGIFKPLSLEVRTRNPFPRTGSPSKRLASTSTACYAEALRQIIKAVDTAGAQVWLATQKYSKHEDFAGKTDAEQPLQAAIRTGVEQHNEIVREICRDTPALFLDVAPLMPRKRTHHSDAVNLNAEGYRIKAKLMLDLIGDRLPQREGRN